MKIVYLGIGYPRKGDQNIYTDLMAEFLKNGHKVTVLCSGEDDNVALASREDENGIDVIRVKTGSIVGNVSVIKKGIATFLVDYHFKKAAKKLLHGEQFDLILCSTPPITLVETIAFLKKHNNAPVYLMLKDIFPQNAVDMEMMGKNSPIYRYFRLVEKRLYRLSDYIGCMSEANMRYVLQHNPSVDESKVGLCVNSCADRPLEAIDKVAVRELYDLPWNATVFLYGGNLGQPQGIDFLVRFLKTQCSHKDRFYLICGKGKDAWKIQEFMDTCAPDNVRYIPWLEYEKFEELTHACDVGMIFLDHRFSIPNFPSRLLSVMRSHLPVLAATDISTDINQKIAEGDFGWWCESTDENVLSQLADTICADPEALAQKGENAYRYYQEHYTCQRTYAQIMQVIMKESTK